MPDRMCRRLGIVGRWAAALLALGLAACSPEPPGEDAAGDDGPLYDVAHVVDGDTLVVVRDGERETVRLIGIDAPETGDGRTRVECFGREAQEAARQLLDGRRVRLATDPTQDTRDRYGRVLAYAWLEDGTFVNQLLVAEGYAQEYTYDLPYQFQRALRRAEDRARDRGAGLWAPEACGGG